MVVEYREPGGGRECYKIIDGLWVGMNLATSPSTDVANQRPGGGAPEVGDRGLGWEKCKCCPEPSTTTSRPCCTPTLEFPTPGEPWAANN